MASIISGLGAGIDLQSIVSQLMAAERAPITKMTALKTAAQSAQTSWGTLSGYMTSLRTAASALSTTTKASAASATSSDTSAVTVSAAPGAQLGSLSLSVQQLAVGQQLSSGALTGAGMLVGAGSATVTAGLSSIGATRIALDGTVADGVHKLQVTRASAPAAAVGTSAPALDLTGSSDLTITTTSGNRTVNLSSYASASALVADLGSQLSGFASVSLVAGQLRIASLDEGSGASLQVAGSAAGALGLAAGTTTGQDPLLTWDGVATTVTHVVPGQDLTLGSGVTLTAGGHLGVGTASSNVIRTTASTTLADLSYALNLNGSPAGAAVVDTGDGTDAPARFVLSAAATGTAGALTIDATGISVLGAGQLTTVAAAQDARLTVGGTTVTRSSNTVSDLVPGVTLNLLKTSTAVSVNVTRDTKATADLVSSLVASANALISGAGSSTAYNATTKTSGPLAGDSGARSLKGAVLELLSSTTGAGTTKALSQLGIESTRDGQLKFDSAVFTAQVAKDPDGAAGLLSAFAKKLEDYAKATTQSDGTIGQGKASTAAEIKRRQDQIDAFELRMTAKQKNLSARYAALDSALGALKSQQTRLASQISGLATY